MPSAQLESIILFVKNVRLLSEFYTDLLDCTITERSGDDWHLLDTGGAYLGLHRIGDQYLDGNSAPPSYYQNTKLVFLCEEALDKIRERLVEINVSMREIQDYPQWGYAVCDGEDPEGNIFQLKKKLAH